MGAAAEEGAHRIAPNSLSTWMSERRMTSGDSADPGICLLTMTAELTAIETVRAAVQEIGAIAGANRPRRATVVATVTVSMAREATCATATVQETDAVVKMTPTVQILTAADAIAIEITTGVIAHVIDLEIVEIAVADVTPATLAILAVVDRLLRPRRTRTTVMSVQYLCSRLLNRAPAANCRSFSNRWELWSTLRSSRTGSVGAQKGMFDNDQSMFLYNANFATALATSSSAQKTPSKRHLG
jgi:hypothetical protein